MAITPPTPVVEVGGQITLTAKVTGPPGISQTVIWSAIDPEIVSVSNTGLVTGLADGSGRVRAAWAQNEDVWNQVFVQVTATPVEDTENARARTLRVR